MMLFSLDYEVIPTFVPEQEKAKNKVIEVKEGPVVGSTLVILALTPFGIILVLDFPFLVR